MAAMTDYFENVVINHILRNQAYTPVATIYVGLYTAAPSDTGGGTEVTGGAYARQSISLGAGSLGATDNTADITFPTASAGWGTVTHVGIFDASTGGNLLMYGALTASRVVNNGDIFKILAGNCDLSFD
jgi:hypothetical protein